MHLDQDTPEQFKEIVESYPKWRQWCEETLRTEYERLIQENPLTANDAIKEFAKNYLCKIGKEDWGFEDVQYFDKEADEADPNRPQFAICTILYAAELHQEMDFILRDLAPKMSRDISDEWRTTGITDV